MTGTRFIRRLHISHNTPCFPAKILHNLCFYFFLGITAVPREIEDNAYAKFWGANKVHYGTIFPFLLEIYLQLMLSRRLLKLIYFRRRFPANLLFLFSLLRRICI